MNALKMAQRMERAEHAAQVAAERKARPVRSGPCSWCGQVGPRGLTTAGGPGTCGNPVELCPICFDDIAGGSVAHGYRVTR